MSTWWRPQAQPWLLCAVCTQQAASCMQHSAQRDTQPHLIPAIIIPGKLSHNPGDRSRLTAELECKCLTVPGGHLSACTMTPVSKSSESVKPGCKQWMHTADQWMLACPWQVSNTYADLRGHHKISIHSVFKFTNDFYNYSIIPCLKPSHSVVPEALQTNFYSGPEASSITCW